VPGTVTDSWLRFTGILLIEVEEPWDDTERASGPPPGEIINRIALHAVVDSKHQRRSRWLRWLGRKDVSGGCTGFVGEVARFNPRALVASSRRQRNGPNPLPFFSRAEQFSSLGDAIEWLSTQPLIAEGSLRVQLDEDIKRLRHEFSEPS
jgi:hypothetical protein